MALQFELDSLEGLDESIAALYSQHGEKFRLGVEGIDPADELKEALRKEREERASAKAKLSEYEKAQQDAEQKRLEEKQEFEKLYRQEQEGKSNLAKELDDLKTKIANKERNEQALSIVGKLTRDTARAELLQDQAMSFIYHTPEGIKINGPDGEAWDAEKLTDHLKERYPFLVDGSQASGGGAAGGASGGADKKFNDYTPSELSKIRQEDPAKYDRLRANR